MRGKRLAAYLVIIVLALCFSAAPTSAQENPPIVESYSSIPVKADIDNSAKAKLVADGQNAFYSFLHLFDYIIEKKTVGSLPSLGELGDAARTMFSEEMSWTSNSFPFEITNPDDVVFAMAVVSPYTYISHTAGTFNVTDIDVSNKSV